MLYPEQHLHEDLQVFTFNQMVGYMETAIEKGAFYINQLSNEKFISKI